MTARVLLTGGTGFIGRNLAPWLAGRGFEVLAPPRAEMTLDDDASVLRWAGTERVDAVIHCATVPAHRNAKPHPSVAFTDLRMFFNLVRAFLDVRFIVIGSGSEYDSRHYSPKLSEDCFGVHVPAEQSAFSKFVVSQWCAGKPRFLVLRPFGVFGPGEDWEIRFVSNAICKALFDRPISIRQNRRFDYLWVDDLGPVVEWFLDRECPYPALNVTPDESADLVSIARIVLGVDGKDLPIHVRTPGMGSEYSGDNRRLKAAMPSFCTTPLNDAIVRLTTWYHERMGSIDPKLLAEDK
jgi:GDP-L-fucose synthase